jgi:hypothetical protein
MRQLISRFVVAAWHCRLDDLQTFLAHRRRSDFYEGFASAAGLDLGVRAGIYEKEHWKPRYVMEKGTTIPASRACRL